MAGAKFLTSDGRIVFPCYCSKEKKLELKKQTDLNEEFMWCACSMENKLFYRFSVDLKLIPVHRNYVHKDGCPKQIDRTKRAYYQTDEGYAVAFLKFNPASISAPSKKQIEEFEQSENITLKAEKESSAEEKSAEKKSTSSAPTPKSNIKEKNLGILDLIKNIINDAFLTRQESGKKPLSADFLYSVVNSRTKTVILEGFQKPLKSLTLEEDHCQFFYNKLKFIGYNSLKNRYTLSILTNYYNGSETIVKEKELFAYELHIKKAMRLYEEQYGYPISEALSTGKSVMIAGFTVQKQTKGEYNKFSRIYHEGKKYTVLGRFAIFNISDNGIPCLTDIDEQVLNTVIERTSDRQYILPSENDNYIIGISNKNNKELYFYAGNKPPKADADTIFSCKGINPDPDEIRAWIAEKI